MNSSRSIWRRRIALGTVAVCALIAITSTAYLLNRDAKASLANPSTASPQSVAVNSGTARSAQTQSDNHTQPSSALTVDQPLPRQVKFFPKLAVDTPAVALYASLLRTPTTAEHSAAFNQFAKTLVQCWMARHYQRMANLVAPSKEPELHGAAQRIAQEERERNAAICTDIPDEAFDQSDAWIAELARQGDEHSMFTYATELFWIREPMRALRDPQKLIDYRATTRSYLNRLIDAGYPSALAMMGSMKLNPVWDEPQPGSAWAYMYAAALARGDNTLAAKLLMSIDRNVPAAEQAAAVEEARALLERCCGRHPTRT